MAEAGADVLVPHMGLTTGGTIGAETAKTLDDCVALIQAMHDAAKTVNPDLIVLCHGGPIAEPDDAAYVLARTTGVVGFFGAPRWSGCPTETAMTENMRRFKAIPTEGAGDEQVRDERAMSRRRRSTGVRRACAARRRARAATRSWSWTSARARLVPRVPQAPRQDEMIIVKAGRDGAVAR